MTAYKGLDVALKEIGANFRTKALDAAKAATDEVVKDLNQAVAPWKTRIVFRVKVVARTGLSRYQIAIEGNEKALAIFKWVDEGTKAHRIPKLTNTTAKTLVFFTPYSARTAPVANPKAGTGKAGNQKNIRRFVWHPGTEARAFIAYAKLQLEEDFKRRMSDIIRGQ